MANTYTQIYLQLVFSPMGRENIIPAKHKEELHKYITGIIQNRKHKLLAINSMPDHIHIFAGYDPSQSLPDLLRDIKAISSKFINEKNGFVVNSYGRKDMVHFLIAILRLTMLSNTSTRRKSITERSPSKRNILKYYINLMYNLIHNIYLIGIEIIA